MSAYHMLSVRQERRRSPRGKTLERQRRSARISWRPVIFESRESRVDGGPVVQGGGALSEYGALSSMGGKSGRVDSAFAELISALSNSYFKPIL